MNTLLSLILLYVTFFSIVSSQSSAQNYGNLIERKCKQTPYFQVCYSCLTSEPQSSRADVTVLALIAVNKINDNATSVIDYIKELHKWTKDLSVKTAFQGCNEAYNTVVNVLLPEALEALTKGNIKFVYDGISNTGRERQRNVKSTLKTCEACTPLTESNNYVNELSEVVLSIVNTLL